MGTEQALAKYYTGSYMLGAKAQAVITAEANKGCDDNILSHPVALEPSFNPIVSKKALMTLDEIPSWVFEAPSELIRFRVWLSPDQPFSWNGLEQFIKQLSLASHRIGLEITGNLKKIFIILSCNRSDISLVRTSFASKLKFCRISTKPENPFFNIEPYLWNDIGFYDYFPLPPYTHLLTRPDELHTSPYEALITAMANISPPAIGLYQVLFQPVSPNNNWHRNIEILTDLEYMLKLVSNAGHAIHYAQQAPSGALGQMAGDVETKAHNDKPFYAAAFRTAVIGAGDKKQDFLKTFKVFSGLFQHGGRPLSYISEDHYSSVLTEEQIIEMFQMGLTYRPGFIVNSSELVGLVHFPDISVTEQLEADIDKVEKLSILISEKLSEGTPIGTATVANQQLLINIPYKLRLCHTYLIGKPRKGKTSLLENMIIDDIKRGYGVAVLDPHHDMVQRLLTLIPEKEIPRVIYFDPADSNWVPLWNPMQRIPGQDIGRITDDMIGVLKSFVSGWGDRLEHILRQAIFGLLHIQGSTLRDVYDILSNSNQSQTIRKLILEVIQNDLAQQFWKDDISKYRPDELGPPKHKLSKLLISDSPVSLMLSQPRSAFNFRRIMDDGMIFLGDLSSKLGSEVKEVLGGLMVAVMYISALSRSDMPIEKRRPFHIYLDEAPKFVTDTLEEIIAEAPKHGVSLTLAHQYLKQFEIKKVDALCSVGTMIVFNIDSSDAGYLKKDFMKKVDVNDFINLEVGEAIVRCGTEIVKIKTKDPLEEPQVNFKDRIIQESHKKYYMPFAEVRRIISQRKDRANKPFEPLAPKMDNRKNIFLPGEFEYDEF